MSENGIDADVLLRAYAYGVFPMAESQDDPELYWIDPEQRGILPLDGFHVPRRLARTVKTGAFTVTADKAFADVMRGCAAPGPDRDGTWINDRIFALYAELYERGDAHSVECWLDGELVGGLYGVSLGAAFFGESMFSRARDASKVALVHLVGRLKAGGYRLLDTQFVTEHLKQFGAVEIPRTEYRRMLHDAVVRDADFYCWPLDGVSPILALQSSTQTS